MLNNMNSCASACKNMDAGNGMGSNATKTMNANMSAIKSTNVEWNASVRVRQRAFRSIFCAKQTQRGFTLIELLIAVAIIGILAAVAVPSYSIYITNANRTDAMSFLTEVAGEQQRFFSENNEYAEKMSELGYGTADTAPSPEGHYTISVTNSSAANTDYVLSATPVAGGRQAGDDECDVFTISSTGAKANTGGSSSNCW